MDNGDSRVTLTESFFEKSKIPKNSDSKAIMDFLTSAESVNRMIVCSELGLPALTGVVSELERRFADCKHFPLNNQADNKNAPNRRNVGWMVRAVMREYGYSPTERGLPGKRGNSGRTRIGIFTRSQYFDTSAVYAKGSKLKPQYEIHIQICRKESEDENVKKSEEKNA